MAFTIGIPGSGDYTYDVAGVVGAETISLGELLTNPGQAIPQVQRTLMNNYQTILVGSFFPALSVKIAKKVLRRPIARINTGLFGKRGIIGHIGFKL